MSLDISSRLLAKTKSPSLESYRPGKRRDGFDDREYFINVGKVDDEGIKEIGELSKAASDHKTARACDAILRARSGKFDKAVPNFKAFEQILKVFLRHDMIDGWIYTAAKDGKHYPLLVTRVSYDSGSGTRGKDDPTVSIHTLAYGKSNVQRNRPTSVGLRTGTFFFRPADVVNRRLADILAAEGIYKETEELKKAHEVALDRYHKKFQREFAQQFRMTGQVYSFKKDDYRNERTLTKAKVIHDLAPSDFGPLILDAESELVEKQGKDSGAADLPEHPVIEVFDLARQEYFWCHADNLTPYKYDKTLRDKLILPQTHRDLLDILTTNLDAFTSDIIEGKSAGNVILGKGIPGVGKTLTAEVYSELIERPLYKVHSGKLGTTAEEIEKSLQGLFQTSKRWNCVLLLDEADVFVKERGDNIEQNAIVAEFLRTLEYFDGLLFMTTNRPNDIDEAILSRCVAIIDYEPPKNEADATAVWNVQAANNGVELSAPLLKELYQTFPNLPPRDAKNLLRLVLRSSAKTKEELTISLFRKCAMFRAIKMEDLPKAA